MATILVTWELGGGLGHVSRLQQVVDELARRGHDVCLALRNVNHATMMFDPAVRVLQAPFRVGRVSQPYRRQANFAHLLHNVGFDCLEDLRARTHAWETLYRLVSPDVILFDHSPTALLASWQRDVARITIGTGFCCPPRVDSLPDWRPKGDSDTAELRASESAVLSRANQLMEEWGQEPFPALADLYARVDEAVLTTFPELDHYQPPRPGRYWGTLPSMSHGAAPAWPNVRGKRIFGYLKRGRYLPAILKGLAALEASSLVFVPAAPDSACAKYTTKRLQVVSRPQAADVVSRQCDIAVTHGGHGMTTEMLLAGKPCVVLPHSVEQSITAKNLSRMKAGFGVSSRASSAPETVIKRLVGLSEDPRLADGARAFATRYAKYDGTATRSRLLSRVEELASKR